MTSQKSSARGARSARSATPPRSLMGIGDVPQLRLGSLSQADLAERLAYFARRAATLCGTILVTEEGREVPKPIGETLATFFTSLLSSTTDAAKLRERAEFLHKVENGDPICRAQFCAARMEEFNNFVTVQLDWINFFATIVTLGENEWPVEQNTSGSELKCVFVGEDGMPDMVKVRKGAVETRIPLRYLTTPVVRMKEVDIYRGSVVDAALAVLRMSYDLANKENYEFFRMVKANAYVTTFDNSQAAKERNAMVLNQYIDRNNLPAGNDIIVPGATTTSYFDFPVLNAIINYAARFNGLFPEGNLRPTGRIRLPSSHVEYFGSAITPAGSTSNPIANALLENGWNGIGYRRIDWVFIPDATLPASEAIAYPEFNFKPARVYHKPSLDKEVVRTGQEDHKLFEANDQERQMRKVYGASINSSNIWKFARFRYQLAA